MLIKFTKDNISVGTHTHVKGDVVEVPDKAAFLCFEHLEAELAENPKATPSPELCRYTRLTAAGYQPTVPAPRK